MFNYMPIVAALIAALSFVGTYHASQYIVNSIENSTPNVEQPVQE